MGISGPGIGGVRKGDGDGFVVKYDTATRVKIISGIYEVDGVLFNLDADDTHDLTGLTTGDLDFHYIYLDKSASSINVPVFYDETAEPVKNAVKNGHYHPTNTEDRVVGRIESPDGLAEIQYFDTVIMSNKLIRTVTKRHTIAVAQGPDTTWQTPNVAESSTFLSVLAIEAGIHVNGGDDDGPAWAGWRSNEGAVGEPDLTDSISFAIQNSLTAFSFWGPLGPTRNVKIGGNENDDDVLAAFVMGEGYTR